MKVTVALISKSLKINRQTLSSIQFADEIIVVVDSHVKKSIGDGKVKYFFHSLNHNFAQQRNFALSHARHDWVLFVDDDEYVGKELAREIQSINEDTHYQGFFLRRIDVCFHHPLRYGETGHTTLLRLARKSAGKFFRPVHERWNVSGKTGRLDSPLYHQKDTFVGHFLNRMLQYAPIDARVLIKENKPFALWRLFAYPQAKFIQNYFGRLGFLDGLVGLFSAYLMSVQSFTVRVFQWSTKN
jgi:glycosyltransferase involved in cell wall biosynthesis